ncbi:MULTISPECIES: restriction endonuclease subunit S [unclassified Staphylococcus]|uniref:restriction endonuclease subunit S n=1 Tax=unclassified Staphylococcus TaxID=91994 RepID=UPI00195022D6|nr:MULTISPECIES: restriction endonuclease subunit S [unclassified Staphylococcus]MCG2357969.1 restriction endonuclease subunit S [Staphylococcus epidermidis]
MEYNKCELQEIASMKYGKMPKKDKIVDKGYPIYSGYKITGFYEEYMYDDEMIIVVARGVGGTGDVKLSPPKSYITNLSIILDTNENLVDKKYLQLLLHSMKLKYLDSGSAQSQITINDLKRLKICLPNIKHQKKISSFIKLINRKIEINQNIIANLEELSKTLFKRWFVDFEFPDENGNPYKSSGGEMVDSELGKIPKGWECVYLKDIVHHKKDTFNPKKSNESEVKHFSLPAFDSGQYPTIDNVTDIKSNKWIIDENCILFSKMNPTTRRIWVTSYNENFLNVASSEFVVLKSDNSYRNAFIYNICISDKFNEYLVSNTTGSTNSRQRVKPDIAVQYRFAYNEEVSYLLSEKIEPYIEKIKIIREQNQNLTQIRDTLLPKLMSGEIEIPDDIEVNEDELSI